MRLVAHCLGLSETEIQAIKDIKNDAGIRVITQNQLTTVKAVGVYADLLEVIVVLTQFKNFEVHLT